MYTSKDGTQPIIAPRFGSSLVQVGSKLAQIRAKLALHWPKLDRICAKVGTKFDKDSLKRASVGCNLYPNTFKMLLAGLQVGRPHWGDATPPENKHYKNNMIR